MSLFDKKVENIYFVDPASVAQKNKKYSKILATILDFCYGSDYPGTSTDEYKNFVDIRSGKQKTVFWAITDNDKKDKKFGTSSMIDVGHEFGRGFVEMGKSGSMGDSGSKYGYARFIKEWEQKKYGLDVFSSILTTVRNCPERIGKKGQIVKAGIGVRILFLKYLKFEQWGLAPWYLMPDDNKGSYEILDLLLKYRNRHDNLNFLKKAKVSLYYKRDRDLLDKFVKLNYKTKVSYADTTKHDEENTGWTLFTPTLKSRSNPQMLVHTTANKNTFHATFKKMKKNLSAANIVILPLEVFTLKIQKFIKHDGWILIGFIPGSVKSDDIEPYKGMWVKLNSKQPIIKPLYLSEKFKDQFSPEWYFKWVRSVIKKMDKNR